MSKTFLRKRAVADRYGVNVRTIDRWAEDGRLPPPIYRGIAPGRLSGHRARDRSVCPGA